MLFIFVFVVLTILHCCITVPDPLAGF